MEKEKQEIKCPFCNSKDYKIMNDNGTLYLSGGIIFSIILFAMGIKGLAFLIVISVIIAFIINLVTKNTLVVRCNKCNQKYKINRNDLKQ